MTGNCAAPTTLEAVLIKAVITAYSACIRRLRIAIVLDGAIPLWFDAVISLQSRRAPNLRVWAKAPVVIHGYNQLQCPSLQAPALLLPLGVDSIRCRAGDTEETGILPCAPASPASQTLWLAPRWC